MPDIQSGRLTLSAAGGYQEDGQTKTILDQLELVANELEATPGQIALVWTLIKGLFPIIEARTLAHLETSLRAVDIRLQAHQVELLNEISAIVMGYSHELLATVQKNSEPSSRLT